MCREVSNVFIEKRKKKEWKFIKICNKLTSAWKNMNMEKAFHIRTLEDDLYDDQCLL